MLLVHLIVHRLSAVSVFGDVVEMRLLISSTVFGVLRMGLVLTTMIRRIVTDLATSGWTTFATRLLLLLF
jgi:hypothetical protein